MDVDPDAAIMGKRKNPPRPSSSYRPSLAIVRAGGCAKFCPKTGEEDGQILHAVEAAIEF